MVQFAKDQWAKVAIFVAGWQSEVWVGLQGYVNAVLAALGLK